MENLKDIITFDQSDLYRTSDRPHFGKVVYQFIEKNKYGLHNTEHENDRFPYSGRLTELLR
jgi:hypothetical protein